MIDLFSAMMDDEFQDILTKDKILNDLEDLKNDKTDEFFELMSILAKTFLISGLSVGVITPAVWALLYCLGNAYTRGDKPVENIDTDIFLYVLHNGIKSVNEDIIKNAMGFCKLKNLDYQSAKEDIKRLIYISFRPLEMLNIPSSGGDDEEVRYNADWLTKIVSVVAPLTGLKPFDILYNLSLTECFYYYIQEARKHDTKNQIKRHNSAEINQMIYERTLELGKQYFEKNYGDKKA